jgi:hypothetical protein
MQSSLTSAYGVKHRRYNLGFNINDIANYANAGTPFDSVVANIAQCRLRWSKDIMPYTASKLLKFHLLSNYIDMSIQINHQPDAIIFHFIILMSFCSSSLLVLPSYRGDSRAVFVVGPQTQHCYHHDAKVKPQAATTSHWAPDDGRENARNMLSRK